MSSTEKASLLRQSHPQENYTLETVGFGMGVITGLGGSIYGGYEWIAHSSTGLPLAGFMTTLAISTFGLIRARQHHHSQQSSLKDRQFDIERPADSGIAEIRVEIDRLMKSLPIEVEASTDYSIQRPSSESDLPRLIGQLKLLEQYQKGKAGELSRALEQEKQLQAQVETLSQKASAQTVLIEQLQSKKTSASQEASISAKEQKYIKQIEELESTLKWTSEALSIEKEAVEQHKIQLAFFENQIEQLNAMVQQLSSAGLQSPSADVSFESLRLTVSNLYTQSREGSRAGSRSNSTPSSPFKPPASPLSEVKGRALFGESNTDSTESKNG